MAISIGQKCVRSLYLLRGMGNPRVVGPMMAYGFTPEVALEGWRLLMATSDCRLATVPHAPSGLQHGSSRPGDAPASGAGSASATAPPSGGSG